MVHNVVLGTPREAERIRRSSIDAIFNAILDRFFPKFLFSSSLMIRRSSIDTIFNAILDRFFP
jgi:hypothetical protein